MPSNSKRRNFGSLLAAPAPLPDDDESPSVAVEPEPPAGPVGETGAGQEEAIQPAPVARVVEDQTVVEDLAAAAVDQLVARRQPRAKVESPATATGGAKVAMTVRLHLPPPPACEMPGWRRASMTTPP